MEEKFQKLQNRMAECVKGGLCVAFSGGVDSTLLLCLAKEAADSAGEPLRAVLFCTQLHPPADRDAAERSAKQIGVEMDVIEVDELSRPEISHNPPDRCYHCKKLLFETLKSFAAEHGLAHAADGTNADDLLEYRPGLRALKELGIESPLAECGLTKDDVRRLAGEKGLQAKNKPASPCLATRLPYGTKLEAGLLTRIAQGEELLHREGFPICRLRVHGDVVRLEIPREDFVRLEACEGLVQKLKALGFSYITLDLEGFRSGSMDEPLKRTGEG